MGRQTFEDLRGYWPKQADDATGITDYLNRVHKYVVASTMTDPEWQNATVLSGDPVEEVGALKEQSGQDIVFTGSITLCHTLIRSGLVDEYRLFVYPFALHPALTESAAQPCDPCLPQQQRRRFPIVRS